MAVSRKKTEEAAAAAAEGQTSTRSFEVIAPFMFEGKRREVGEVIDNLPVASISELTYHKKIAPVAGKTETRD